MIKVLFLLYSTPIMESIGITTIREPAKLDNIPKAVAAAIINGDISIMGNEAIKFNNIFIELTVSSNGLVLNGKQIVLPETLHKKSTELDN